MAARTDLLLDPSGDLPIGARLMTTGPSDLQHQKDLMASFPGEWKQFIFNGVGTARYIKKSGSNLLSLKNTARQQMQQDGYNVGVMTTYFNPAGTLVIEVNASR
jgi:hypothetical protein